MNTNLMQEIMKATAMVNAMETEVTAAAKELENEVAASRKEKSRHIVEFVKTMQKMLMDAKYPQNQRLYIDLPWSVKEIGQYTNYHWSISLRLSTVSSQNFENIVFGRYFRGSGEVCEEVAIVYGGQDLRYNNTYGKLIYPIIVDGWNEQIESMIETKVAEAVKKTLEDRMKAMTDRLNKATAEHQKYEGE